MFSKLDVLYKIQLIFEFLQLLYVRLSIFIYLQYLIVKVNYGVIDVVKLYFRQMFGFRASYN